MQLPPFAQMKKEIVLMVMRQFPKLAPRLQAVIQEERNSK